MTIPAATTEIVPVKEPAHPGWRSSELAVTTAVGAVVTLVPSLSLWQQLALAVVGAAYSIARAIAKARGR